MLTCPRCGASNPSRARFCGECATALIVISPQLAPGAEEGRAEGRGSVAPDLARSISERMAALQRGRRADIAFVLDCTASMQGEIDAIKDAITGFADSIRQDGVRARVGLVAFRDRLIDEEQQILLFNGEPLTDDPAAFRAEVSRLFASGGGDEPESSLDAVMLALTLPFAPDASKVIVLITDAPPHIPDKETRGIEEVIGAMREAGVGQVYTVMRTGDPRSLVYLRLLEGTRGLAFDLGAGDDFRSRAEHFKRTLMSLGKTISGATI